MTTIELYEIVKDHRDVWEDAIVLCRDGDERYYWASILQDYSIQCSDATAEVALLGLGVKWLVNHPAGGTCEVINGETAGGKKVGICAFFSVGPELRRVADNSILAAVYAAIAEVKRATKETP